MIDWRSIKDVLKGQVALYSRLPPDKVRWVDEPSGPLQGTIPVIYLRISSILRLGFDEIRYEDNTPFDANVFVSGQRQFTLSVRAESYVPDPTDPNSASNIVEAIATRLYRETSLQDRLGIVGVTNFLGANWFNYMDGDRQVNCYNADFTCVTVDNDQDDTDGSGDYIGEVQIASTPLNDVDNEPAASQVILDVKLP